MFILLSIFLTLVIYFLAKRIYKYNRFPLLSPLLITPIILIIFLKIFNLPYESYNEGGKYLTYLLQPATVALALPLYKYFYLLKKHALELLGSITAGSIIAILSSIFLSHLLYFNSDLTNSMIPHSITTPLAMSVSNKLGGIESLTACFVILTGIMGIIIGPILIKIFSINNKIARGVLLGVGAHGTGTAKAFEFGLEEGTIASLAMIIAASTTVILAPILVSFI